MINLKSILEGQFDTTADLLMNPNYDQKTMYELFDDFRKDGGEIVGTGKFGTVLSHPSWKFILKIFSDDVPYLKYVRFVLKNPRPSFPIFYDTPRKIRPHYKRVDEYLYVVKTEKLDHISIREFDDLQFYLYYKGSVSHSDYEELSKTFDNWRVAKEKVERIKSQYFNIDAFYDDYHFLMEQPFGSPDIHSKNIMKRTNGSFVLADPFWVGETPYQAYDRMMKAERDYDGDYDREPDYIAGGERKKKKPAMWPYINPKKSVKKLPNNNPGDDVPF